MDKETIVKELYNELRVNNSLRHRMGIDSAAEMVAASADGPVEAVVFTDKDGKDWALAVLEQEE
jgi:gamma-glutamyl-gamma-aminobutyrate hydrolase PuuD